MARLIGIAQNTVQVFISGARVAYDPRSTAEADATRFPRNLKADEKPMRKMRWELRRKSQNAVAEMAEREDTAA